MGHAKFECALYVMCRGDKQKKELAKRFEEEHPGNNRLFMWESHKSPNRIDFALSSGEFASYLDDDILAIAEWLQTNFKLKIQGYCYEQDEDTAARVPAFLPVKSADAFPNNKSADLRVFAPAKAGTPAIVPSRGGQIPRSGKISRLPGLHKARSCGCLPEIHSGRESGADISNPQMKSCRDA